MSALLGNSLLRNSILLMVTTVVNSALGYAFWVLVARSDPPHAVGVATAIVAAFTLVSLLTNLGAHSTLVESLPSREAGREWSLTVNAAVLSSCVAGAVAGALCVVVLPSLVSGVRVLLRPEYAVLFILAVVLNTATFVLDFACVAERASGKMLARNLVFVAVRIPLFLALAEWISGGALQILTAWVLALAVSLLFSVGVLIRRLGHSYAPVVRGIRREVRRILRSLVGQHVINLGGTIPMYLLPLVVTARLSATDNAYFYTTWMVGCLFFMVSAWVAISLFAEGSHSAHELAHRVRTSWRIILALLIPAMVLVVIGGRPILAVFGPSYTQGYLLLVVLAGSAIPDAITNVYVSILRVERRILAAGLLNVGMAIATVSAAWLLLPSMGIAGGGVGWLIGESLGSAWVLEDVIRRRRVRRRVAAVAARRRSTTRLAVGRGPAWSPGARMVSD